MTTSSREKRLGQAGVKNSDLILQQSDAQTAENALQNNCPKSGVSRGCAPSDDDSDAPEPDRQNDGEKSDDGSDQAMGVLEKNSADPFRDREKKHVVAESRRPIGHGETDAFARDHSAAANEKERRGRREPGKAMEPTERRFGIGSRMIAITRANIDPVAE